MNDIPDTDTGNNNSYANSKRFVEEIADVHYADEPRNKLNKGDELNLTGKDPAINEIMAGIGWDLKGFDSDPPDLDASIFLLNAQNKTRQDDDFIFYNALTGCDGAVQHLGDSRTGAGEGDDEMIKITLNVLPFDVVKIVFVLSIYNLDLNDHNFSMVKNAYFRLVNESTQSELFRYELDDELQDNEGLIIGEMERIGAEWHFKAVGETIEGGLSKIADDYGIIVHENML